MISAFRSSRFALALVPLFVVSTTVFADDPPKAKTSPEAKKSTAFDPVEITIHPKSAPVPALKYRLLPLEPDRTPGDAVPIYDRLGAGMVNAEEVHKKVLQLILLPDENFSLGEARKLVDQQRGKLDQLGFGARRQTCNWGYTLLEQREDSIEILLPDVQDMRNWARLLQLKVRVEIAEKKYGDAIRSMETGIAVGRHVGEGPFLINTLVGMAISQTMLAKIEEMITQPDAPNLYWALSALPEPLIPIRTAMEIEQQLGERIVPEITELDRPRTEGEWSALLARLHTRLINIQQKYKTNDKPFQSIGQDTTLAQFRTVNLADAKAYVNSRGRSTERMSDDEILVRSVSDRYRELRDDWFKFAYLPYSDMARFETSARESKSQTEKGSNALFAAMMPAIVAAKYSQARTDRRVAALRIIEALRMHAAEKQGSLPASLDEITLVPIPLDPVTDKPFSYSKAGDVATLSGPAPATGQPGLTYHITLKK